MTRRGVENNNLLRSLNEEASDPTETEIYNWQDLQQHITMSRGGNSWKLTLPRNENHLTCPTRRHDESKGFPLSTRLWDLLYTITWSTASAITWTSNTPRHDVATDTTVARSGKFGLRCEIDFITQTRNFNVTTLKNYPWTFPQELILIRVKMLSNDQQL